MLDTAAFRALRGLPGCVGISVWSLDDGPPSTILALDGADDDLLPDLDCDAAVLDAVQYVDTGPGTDAVQQGMTIDGATPEVMRRNWALFAAAAGARGVRGVVAVPFATAPQRAGAAPVGDPGQMLGVVLLYLARPTLVDLSLVRLAETVGVVTLLQQEAGHEGTQQSIARSAPAVLRTADGTTTSREGLATVRALSPAHTRVALHEKAQVGLAGLLLERETGLALGEGRTRLREAATRAGISPVALAETLTEVLDQTR
ncbi:MAG: hypothetical protein JWN84_2663 [Nocardioides sp.]|nr:hypothetical protein [Nocardioides sp.]